VDASSVRLAGPAPLGLASVVAGVCLAGCAASTQSARETNPGETISISENQRVLTPAESRRLVRWLTRLRACLEAQGVEVGELLATRKQLTLPVDRELALRTLLRRGIACGERLGDPPPGSSLQAFRGRLILYLPRACILDSKVAAGVGTAKPGG
jgi:hypothetical protein